MVPPARRGWGRRDRRHRAEDDIRQATELARDLVTRWGMSDAVGSIAVPDQEDRTWPGAATTSAETLRAVDAAVRELVDGQHRTATRVLSEHRDSLDRLAHALLERETLDEPQAREAVFPTPSKEEVPHARAALAGRHRVH